MTRHIADHSRDHGAGLRAREYARIERTDRAGGPHPATRALQRRPAEVAAPGRRMREFLERKRHSDA